MSCATPNLLSGPLGHVPETAGHVAETVGHDPETAGHLHPKYAQGSVMSYSDSYLSLDPIYKDAFGQPLLRVTFDWHENEFNMIKHCVDKAEGIARTMTDHVDVNLRKAGTHFDTRVYQTTHTTGGAIMGSDPKSSVVNKYLQSWDVHNVFVLGASAFPQNFGYNPTGLVGALTYWAAHAVREQYLKSPGPLVQA